MEWIEGLKAWVTGVPRITQENGKAVLTGRYPNPEKGQRITLVAFVLALVVLIGLPALYYAPVDAPADGIGALFAAAWDGLPHAIIRVGDIPAAWSGADPAPDLQGWSHGLALSFFLLIVGGMIAALWSSFTDKPYLRIEADRENISIQRGAFGTPMILPRDEITGVHVGRRDRGTYDVLIQRGDELVPVAITKGRESKALALKTKIERVISIHLNTEL